MDPWKKVLHAYEEGNVCPQWDYLSLVYMGREDCLFLNVFTREVYDETMILWQLKIYYFVEEEKEVKIEC